MKKKILTILTVCLMALPLVSFGQFPASIVVTGGNGTSDGEQVNRDYEFTAFPSSNCWIVDLKVVNKSSTSFHQRSGNSLYLVWKPSYVGTTQQIRVDCECEMTILNLIVPFSTTKNYTLHN